MIIIISCRQSMSSTIFNKISTQFQKKSQQSALHWSLQRIQQRADFENFFYYQWTETRVQARRLRTPVQLPGRRACKYTHIHTLSLPRSPALSVAAAVRAALHRGYGGIQTRVSVWARALPHLLQSCWRRAAASAVGQTSGSNSQKLAPQLFRIVHLDFSKSLERIHFEGAVGQTSGGQFLK